MERWARTSSVTARLSAHGYSQPIRYEGVMALRSASIGPSRPRVHCVGSLRLIVAHCGSLWLILLSLFAHVLLVLVPSSPSVRGPSGSRARLMFRLLAVGQAGSFVALWSSFLMCLIPVCFCLAGGWVCRVRCGFVGGRGPLADVWDHLEDRLLYVHPPAASFMLPLPSSLRCLSLRPPRFPLLCATSRRS